MISILVNDIIPILVIMILGYLCGKFSFFNDDQRQGLNKLVLNIALPAALFVSIVNATRHIFAQDIVLTLISIFGGHRVVLLSYVLDKVDVPPNNARSCGMALIARLSPTIRLFGFCGARSDLWK